MTENTAKYLAAACVIDAGGDPVDKAWLNILPPDQYNPTSGNFLWRMVLAIAAGGNPQEISDALCPVAVKFDAAGNRTISYTAEVRVNRASALEGHYTLTSANKNCTVSGPVSGEMERYEEVKTEGRDRVQLGWLPDPDRFDMSQVYPSSPRIELEQDDGIIYLDQQMHALLSTAGTALIDKWSVTFEHDFSKDGELPSSVTVVAEWGVDRVEKAEVQIPKCAAAKGLSSFSVGPVDQTKPARTIYYDTCRGSVLEIRYEEQGQ